MRNNIRNRWSADGSGTRAHPPSRGGERLPPLLPPHPRLLFRIPDSSIMQEVKIRLGVAASFLKIGALLPVLRPYLCQFEDTGCCAASEAFRNDLRMKWHLLLLLSAPTCFRGLGCVLLGLFMLWRRNSLWCLVCKCSLAAEEKEIVSTETLFE